MWIDDVILENMVEDIFIQCWIPDRSYVVLGAGNNPEIEVNVSNCHLDKIPVLRRYGGGGTVVLHDGCLIIGIGAWVKNPYGNSAYFQMLNQAVIDCLHEFNQIFQRLEQRGISDICFKEKKIAGTSMFRSKHYLLYQASLLVDLKIERIERYLKHPSKEPEYRKSRKHVDFLTGLKEIIHNHTDLEHITPHILRNFFQEKLLFYCRKNLGDHLVGAQQSHFPALKARLERQR
jgi:lipoate-protein ligase A